jgi:hypothetical protein
MSKKKSQFFVQKAIIIPLISSWLDEPNYQSGCVYMYKPHIYSLFMVFLFNLSFTNPKITITNDQETLKITINERFRSVFRVSLALVRRDGATPSPLIVRV